MIVLGLGTNLGDRYRNIRKAVRLLDAEKGLSVKSVSRVYESEAMLLPDSPPEWQLPFLNAAVAIETSLRSHDLLSKIKRIEEKMGRNAVERWSPRVIDIDILVWDGMIIHDQNLTIPHPGLEKRPFALLPLVDLEPSYQQEYPEVKKWRNVDSSEVPYKTRLAQPLFPEWVGVVNLTPDSFSDGGQWSKVEDVVRHCLVLAANGISVIEFGAESTRPGAENLSFGDEWNRLSGVIEAVSDSFADSKTKPRLSVDSYHPETIKKAVDAGVGWINDVSGLEDPEACRIVAEAGVSVVVMHSLSIPPEKEKTLDPNQNAIELILQWGKEKIEKLEAQGISRKKIIIDPGIGFGKTAEQNVQLLASAYRLHELGVRILIGHSRKSFLKLVTEQNAAARDLETAAISADLARQGIDYLRIHNLEVNQRVVSASSLINRKIRWS